MTKDELSVIIKKNAKISGMKMGKGTKVLIGMTGSIDSTVAAYLLKKQGYDCYGLSLVFKDDSDEELEVTSGGLDIFGENHISDLLAVKKMCEKLGVPHYAAQASDVYKDRVLDFLVSSRIGGTKFTSEVYTSELIVDILIKKAKVLKIDHVVTGHYARKQLNRSTGQVELYAHNDQEHDQSFLLSSLKQDQLEHLLLPLADIRYNEVRKIGENIGVEFLEKERQEFPITNEQNEKIARYVEKNSPVSLRGQGSIYKAADDSFVAEHNGIHSFYIGQQNLSLGVPLDKSLCVSKILNKQKLIYLDYSSVFSVKQVYLKSFNHYSKLDVSKQMSGSIKLSCSDEAIPCSIYFKNNSSVAIELAESQNIMVVVGQTIAVYRGSGRQGKLLGVGEVFLFGSYMPLSRIGKTYSEDELEFDDEESEDKIEATKTYNFRF